MKKCIDFMRQFTRSYDRKRYLKEKRKLKKSTSLENIPLGDHFDLFRRYTMKQEFPIVCAVQLLKEEGLKRVRGVVSLPTGISADTTSVVLVFATGEDADKARKAGAQIVGGEELIQDVNAINAGIGRKSTI
jgi:ribosomal protein L1